MDKPTVLVMSVGTGTGPGGSVSLAGALAYCVNDSAADRVLFVVTHQSQHEVLPLVLENINKDYEVYELQDPDDVNQIYNCLSPKFREIRKSCTNLVVDYTSGTKAMTGALCILGSLYEADTLSYISGQRHQGVVAKGTEKLIRLRPYHIIAEKRLAEAVSLFNNYQFEASMLILSQTISKIRSPEILERVSSLMNAARAYSLWDRFDHKLAFEELKKIKMPEFNQNKAFLGKLLRAESRESYFIADLINNAIRRGEGEQKYDDAVARLYRTSELIAQYLLKQYGIDDTGKVPPDKIPPTFSAEVEPEEGKIKLGLHASYRLLAAFGDKLGKRYEQDKRLHNLLSKRNSSILAHALKAVDKMDYFALKEVVMSYAGEVVPNLDEMLSQSAFIKWPQ